MVRAARAAWSFSRGPHGRGRCLSQHKFHWPYFVQLREWYEVQFQTEGHIVTAFEVAMNTQRGAVFLGTREDGCMFTVDPRLANKRTDMSFELTFIQDLSSGPPVPHRMAITAQPGHGN